MTRLKAFPPVAKPKLLARFVWPRGASALFGPRLSSFLALLAFLEGDAKAYKATTSVWVDTVTPSRT